MAGTTYFLIALTFFLAFALSYYWYRGKLQGDRVFWLLFILRGLSLWGLAVLLINPLFHQYSYITEKPSLDILVDNSASMVYLDKREHLVEELNALKENTALHDAFDVRYYTFGEDLRIMDSLPEFDQGQTNIANAFSRLHKLRTSDNTATLLLSDGNSTYGADYQYAASGWKGPVFTVVAGDTTRQKDLLVARVNVNRYAYTNNKFPVEVFPEFQGEGQAETVMEIRLNDRTVFKQPVTINARTAIEPVFAELQAGGPGVKRYRIVLSSLEGEKNVVNNSYDFAVEVIDQRNRVALVANGSHPDLGALKKILERQGQRNVEVLSPEKALEAVNYDLFILFSPNTSFRPLFEVLENAEKNYLLIGGERTDWRFINEMQPFFNREVTYSREDVQGRVNDLFGEFRYDDPGISDLPPITSLLGDFIMNTSYQVLLYKNINGVESERPLLFTMDRSGRRLAVLDGSGLWKWRLWHYAEHEDFTDFDAFWNKLTQYLLTGSGKSRLNAEYNSFYYGNSPVSIRAGYYDKNFVFDPTESMQLRFRHEDSLQDRTVPMMAEDHTYSTRVNGLAPGTYTFKVDVPAQDLSTSGQFTVLEYDVEKQFVNTDNLRMKYLASRTGGRFGTLNNLQDITDELLRSNTFKPVQKRKEEVVSLVEWPWMLLSLALLLGLEWLIRKYNGLI